jgi:hypothetical protein
MSLKEKKCSDPSFLFSSVGGGVTTAKAVWLGMFLAAWLLPTLPGNSQSANPALLPARQLQI